VIQFLYGTDFHGNITKYETILKYALENNISLIHLGADILPKGSSIMEIQKKFVRGYLKDFYNRCKEHNITVLAMWGNDDLYTRKKYFRKYATLLDETPYVIDNHTFKGYGYVPDYPFLLKSACKYDSLDWVKPEADFGPPKEVGDNGFIIIGNVPEYFKNKGTIKEDLDKLSCGPQDIWAIHSPPCGIELDVCQPKKNAIQLLSNIGAVTIFPCHGNRRVGSKSVYEFIEKNQPLIVLSGHVHENYYLTKTWKGYIGKTLVIQPGQSDIKTSLVRIEIDDDIKAYFMEI
jgi:Icc-related predicted phosphoesterase